MTFNYLKSFCELLRKTEVPPRFAIWSGVASLLSMLERRVEIPQGIYTVYPNFYIVLVAASGQKKSTPINFVDKLLRKVHGGPNVVSQKITPEALLDAIQKKDMKLEGTKIIKSSCGGVIFADELATFLDRSSLDRGLGPILTKLYDCSPLEYKTIARGTATITGGYLSILGGTTVELIRSSLPREAIGGGFTSRTVFVYEDQIAPPVAWIEYNQELADLEQLVINHLQKLTELNGVITLTPEAKEAYITDYNQRYDHSPFRRDATLQGYENRRGGHLLKIAMAFMVAEEPTLTLEISHLLQAKFLLEETEKLMPRVMELIVSMDVGVQASMVYQFIKSFAKGCSRTDVMRHFTNKLDASELTKVINTLRESERILITTREGKLYYLAKDDIKLP